MKPLHGRSILVFLAFSVLLLSGCAGKNFVRPSVDSIQLGKTTQTEISKRMGKPYAAGSMEKNGVMFNTASYAYANTGSSTLYPGVTGARSQGFYFHNGVVVGSEFTSSFKEDGTDFDESKLASIKKGETTVDNVVNLLGRPSGEFIFPLTASAQDKALVYLYMQTKGSAFNLRFYKKALTIAYNESGIVTDVHYVAEGNKD